MSDQIREQLLDAALLHVPFDGWSDASWAAALADSGVDPALARAICPRRATDLAIAYHQRGDAVMLAQLASTDLSALRFRDRVATALRFRIEAVDDKELVRRGTTLFALPHLAADGAKLMWGTADHIWCALGDTSEDVNWYTKRATLSAVYSATVLFWLGDDSPDHGASWAFLDRRIDNVMQFEKLKASPAFAPLAKGFGWLTAHIKAPGGTSDLPGAWRR